MDSNEDKIEFLLKKLDALSQKQTNVNKELNELREEVSYLLYSKPNKAESEETAEKSIDPTEIESPVRDTELPSTPPVQTHKQETPKSASVPPLSRVEAVISHPKKESDLEKFIGENLINKIGIVITVIGVAIGAKYSIEHDLISPLTRIILGYLAGIVLIAIGMKLKKNYHNYSAVLVSGAMAIMYFITFAAFSFYGLFPKGVAFALMLVFTVFTVLAALKYDQQVIALIGLAGAYGVPFLLSDGTGDVRVLFIYIAIINIGILIISFKKYWKPVYYTAFVLTWLIFLGWFGDSYDSEQYFATALIFNTVFFAIFYTTFMAYKLIRNEQFSGESVALLLLNSFIFYGVGYATLDSTVTGSEYLGIFTALNAVIHFGVSMVLYKKKQVDRNLFFLVSGLVLVFITLTIPVQLDGNWVTIIWSAEAALLFWIGRTKAIPVYEKLAYPLMILSVFSILHDWAFTLVDYHSEPDASRMPIFNIRFLTSMIFLACFGFIIWLSRKENYVPAWPKKSNINALMSYAAPVIFILIAYFTFQMEISGYFDQLIAETSYYFTPEGQDWENYYWDYDLQQFKYIWLINYSLFFVALLSFVNIKKLHEETFGYINLFLNALTITVFLVGGLYILSELRETFLDPSLNENYKAGVFNILIRYISLLFVSLTLYAFYKYSKQNFLKIPLKIPFGFLLHITLLWVASSELIHWLDMAGNNQQYKLGLSILWGVYALLLISLGIWKRKQYLRIGAIALFGLTLLKLFFYDIIHLTTIAKTIVFVSLGVLLLIISFLYNKYKANITDDKNS